MRSIRIPDICYLPWMTAVMLKVQAASAGNKRPTELGPDRRRLHSENQVTLPTAA